MKNFKRMAFGIVSSLLLSAGLARAAQHVDPLTQSIAPNSQANVNMTPAPDCTMPCYFQSE
jgi:hypothetical protein